MKTRWIPVGMLAALAAAAQGTGSSGAAAAAALTAEQALDRHAIGDLEFSPDGSRLVFTVTDPPKGTTRERNVWLLDVATGRTRQLTTPSLGGYGARWSPGGESVAFFSDRNGVQQRLYLLSMQGGEAELLADRKERVTSFRWSPDGARLALLMSEAKSADLERRDKDKDDATLVDKSERRERIWLLDVKARALRQLTAGDWRIDEIEWMPSGDRLIAVATDRPQSDLWTERLCFVDVDNGTFTEIARPHGPFNDIVPSPDGRTIAYVGSRLDGPSPHDLWIQSIDGGAARNVTGKTIDAPVSRLRWLDDRTLIAGIARGFTNVVVTVGRETGQARVLEELQPAPALFARASTGAIAYVGETTTVAPELWMKTNGGPPRQVTHVNDRWASIPVAARETVKYPSADGVEIEASLLRPTAADGPAPYPLIVLVHGGPTGRWTDTFEPWGQLLAARGYAVLYPNVRGSTGYGHRFVEMNRADWGGGDFKDVMAGVDAMIARHIADPARLGIGGWSYGGYMAAWAVTQTTRFRAAVSGAPVIDMASEFGTERGSAYDEWFYGTPYEKLEGFNKSSPITFVRNAKTPTLLLQGENDRTDPIGQSQQFYRGLKRFGVDTELVLYPREDHGMREEKHLIDRLNRVIDWYDRHMKPTTNGR